MRRLTLALAVLALAGCSSRPPEGTQAHGKPLAHWVQALQDPDAKVRKRATEVLGNVGAADPQVVPALSGAVKDRDRAVREAAVLALLKIGPAAREAAPALAEASKDSDPKVRTYAAKALKQIQAAP